MNKGIIVLFVALALLQFVRCDDEKPAAGGSNPFGGLLQQGKEAGQKVGDQVKSAAQQAGGAFTGFNPSGAAKPEAPKDA